MITIDKNLKCSAQSVLERESTQWFTQHSSQNLY